MLFSCHQLVPRVKVGWCHHPTGSGKQPFHSGICSIMRTYGKNFVYKQTASYKERQERLATEWDVRVDVNDTLTADNVVSNLREHLDELLYVLVSGVEKPDGEANPNTGVKGFRIPSGSDNDHVHVCIVLLTPRRRRDVLEMVRGKRKLGDEYAAPRNPKFTYAGWVIHHGKPGYKLDGEPLVRFESGTLPMDAVTTDNALAIQRLLKKWGTPGNESRFVQYTKLLEHEKIKQNIERWTMALNDHAA